MNKLNAIDLFCGAGGLSMGLRQAGFEVVGAIENNELACETYKLNHPEVNLFQGDIRKISGNQLLKLTGLKRGELSLLAACPPCQGFSKMRTKNGKKGNKDPRNNLIFEVLRLVRTIRPASVMVENVPGLSDNYRWRKFINGLKELKYNVTFDVLNVKDFGVPQNRRRLVLMADKRMTPVFSPKARISKTVRNAFSKSESRKYSADPLHSYKIQMSKKVSDLVRKIPKNGGSRSALGLEAQLNCHKNAPGFNDVYGRMAWDRPSPTITGGCINPSKGRFFHPVENRPITLREAALLQTFPKTYKFSLRMGRHAAALMIGNALPPEFIKRQVQSFIKIGRIF